MWTQYISQQRKLLRSLRAGIGKTAVLLPTAFMVEAGIGMASLGLIFYMRDVHGLTAGVIGWFAATWLVFYFCGCLIMRRVIAKLRPRYSMILSTVFMLVGIVCILVVPSLALAFVFYGVYGFALSLFWPPMFGWATIGTEGTDLGRAMARVSLAGSIGIVISPLLAGLLSEIEPVLPIYGSLVLFFATLSVLVVASLALPRIKADVETGGGAAEAKDQPDRSSPLRYPAWIGMLATFLVLGMVLNIFPVYARSELLLDKRTVGVLLLVRALGHAVGLFILGRTKFWHFKRMPMIAGLLLLVAVVLVLPLLRSIPALGLLLLVFGLVHSLGFCSSFFHGATGSNSRSQRMAIHEALIACGIVTGSAVGGMLYQNYGMRAATFFCAAAIAVALGLQIGLFVRMQKTRQRSL